MMKNILKICKNEYRMIFTDAGAILILIIGAFLYSLFYSVPFTKQILREVPIAVVDADNSPLSREFIRDLDSSEFLHVISEPLTLEEAKQEFLSNKIRGYVLVPDDFEKKVYRGQKTSVALFADSSYLIVYKQVATGVMTTAMSLGAKLEIGKMMKKGLSKQQAFVQKMPFEFVQTPLYNPAGSYINYIYPIVLILILQQTMLVGVGLLGGTLRERLGGYKTRDDEGNVVIKKLDKVSEFSDNPSEIVLGKALAYSSIYFVHSMIYFLVYPALFCYKMTYNTGLMFLLLIPFLFASAFLALSLIYFYKERESSLLALVVTSLPLVFLPGFVWPKEAIPAWILFISKFIPACPAIDGLLRVNQMGAEFSQVQLDLYILLGLCILYFVIAVNVFKKISKKD